MKPDQPSVYTQKWRRPGRLATISVGIAVCLIGLFLQQRGVKWKYSEIAFGTGLLVWYLLSRFRPVWPEGRFWLVMAAIVATHLAGWTYLANRIERFGFVLMFCLLVAEIALAATVILKTFQGDRSPTK